MYWIIASTSLQLWFIVKKKTKEKVKKKEKEDIQFFIQCCKNLMI